MKNMKLDANGTEIRVVGDVINEDRLYDFDLQEKWYKYRDDCYEQIARDWCERFGIEIEE